MAYRDHTKVVQIGDRKIGGGNPILIQSMTNTPTEDVEATVAQIHRLEEAGCEIIRCTCPTEQAAAAIGQIRRQISIPLVADIHFDYRMAIAAMENGADKIRINPGNIGGKDRIMEVVRCAKERRRLLLGKMPKKEKKSSLAERKKNGAAALRGTLTFAVCCVNLLAQAAFGIFFIHLEYAKCLFFSQLLFLLFLELRREPMLRLHTAAERLLNAALGQREEARNS